MTNLTLTCDRRDGLMRAAVWQDKMLVDLYIDRQEAPDMTGAVVSGKIVRALSGQKAAWVDCGLAERVYFESTTALRTGDTVCLRIKSTMDQGKAWQGVKEKVKPTFVENGEGIIVPPPSVWVRALADLKKKKVSCIFGTREDWDAFLKSEWGNLPCLFNPQEMFYDLLDEECHKLLSSVVSLQSDGNIVIQPTQALVAIDVNAGEARNFTAVNLVAVREALRQIRLRNLSGIIVIDCLKMKERADVSKIINAATRVADMDPAGTRIFGMSKLGLLELIRSRRGPSLQAVLRG